MKTKRKQRALQSKISPVVKESNGKLPTKEPDAIFNLIKLSEESGLSEMQLLWGFTELCLSSTKDNVTVRFIVSPEIAKLWR